LCEPMVVIILTLVQQYHDSRPIPISSDAELFAPSMRSPSAGELGGCARREWRGHELSSNAEK
jgi:hypothetical protein